MFVIKKKSLTNEAVPPQHLEITVSEAKDQCSQHLWRLNVLAEAPNLCFALVNY